LHVKGYKAHFDQWMVGTLQLMFVAKVCSNYQYKTTQTKRSILELTKQCRLIKFNID